MLRNTAQMVGESHGCAGVSRDTWYTLVVLTAPEFNKRMHGAHICNSPELDWRALVCGNGPERRNVQAIVNEQTASLPFPTEFQLLHLSYPLHQYHRDHQTKKL